MTYVMNSKVNLNNSACNTESFSTLQFMKLNELNVDPDFFTVTSKIETVTQIPFVAERKGMGERK